MFQIQLGAFPSPFDAEARLRKAIEYLGLPVGEAHPAIIAAVPLPNGVVMFRARLTKFVDEAQAKGACKLLKQQAMECWDIREHVSPAPDLLRSQ